MEGQFVVFRTAVAQLAVAQKKPFPEETVEAIFREAGSEAYFGRCAESTLSWIEKDNYSNLCREAGDRKRELCTELVRELGVLPSEIVEILP